VRLVDARKVSRWDSRGHFYALAAAATRRILGSRCTRQADPVKLERTAPRA
jgi:hypothetical protein